MNNPDLLHILRSMCLAFPEAVEDADSVGDPAFKVRGKIFAMQHQKDDRPSLWCKAPPGLQEAFVTAEPESFFVPPYVGHHGWIGIWLDQAVDWGRVDELVDDSYRLTAPKRLIKQLDSLAASDGGS